MKRRYVIVTKTAFKKGSQVFISYGKHGNNALLSLYGFVMPSNSEDTVTLDEQFVSAKLDALEPNAELRTRKQRLIENLPLTR